MKTRSFLLAGMAALNLAFIPTLHSQTTTSSPLNPTGSEANSKSTDDSAAQQRAGSTGTAATPASAPDTTSSKDTTNALDKNPSTAPSDSANNSATKEPTTATTEDRTPQGNKGDKSETGTFSDKHFMVKAAQGGMTEVELGQIAQKNGSSADVKQFGARMVADHSKANTELKGLAQQKGVTVPTKLDASHQAMVDHFNKLKGPDFDRAYVKDMAEDHQKDVAEFQQASTSAKDPDVQAFATKTLAVVKGHLADVQNLQSKIK